MERVGILGLPQSGKTTLFEILVQGAGAQAAATSGREQVAVIVVPDPRVDRLSALYHPKKTTHARIQFLETVAAGHPSARAAARGPDLFSGVRNCDALLGVVRGFENPAVPAAAGVDPARDLRDLESELILNDLAIVESRLEKLAREIRVGRKEGEREHVLLGRLRSALEAERPLRGEPFDAEDEKRIRGFQLLTLNPGKTEADAGRWFGHIESTGRLPRTPAPVTFLGAIQTIPSGTSVFLTVDLEAGRRYHISDDESGIEADFTTK